MAGETAGRERQTPDAAGSGIAKRGRAAVRDAIRSITGRKQAEELVCQAEQRYRDLFERAPVMYVITRNEEDIPVVADCNELFLSTLGYTRAEVLERPLADFYTPESRVELLERGGFQRALKGAFTAEERQLLTRDGRLVQTLLRALPETDRDGHVFGTRAMYVDITERKRAEEEMRESEERFRSLSEAAFEGIVVHEGGKILDANEAYTRMFGYELSEVIGARVLDHVAPESRDLVSRNVLSGYARPYEAVGVRKDGSTFPVEACGKTISYGGRKVRVAATRDITERKRAEEVLRERESELRQLTARLLDVQEEERRAVARELHDEIGQLLTGLGLTLETCVRSPRQVTTNRLRDTQGLVDELISRVRDLSLDLRPAMLDDLGLLPALLWHLERYASRTGVHVDFKHNGLETRFAPEVETAAYRIVQEALTNVARHAGVSEAAVRVWADRETLRVRIEDQGTGFDPAAVLAAGHASGLAGMQERAALCGGQLTVDSEPGSGSRLTLEMPAGGTTEQGKR